MGVKFRERERERETLNGEKQRKSTKKKVEAKKKYKEKIEFQFPAGKMRNAWKGLKTLAGHSKPKLNSSNKSGDKRNSRMN